eukprot:5273576-Amphidinium_carterae.2
MYPRSLDVLALACLGLHAKREAPAATVPATTEAKAMWLMSFPSHLPGAWAYVKANPQQEACEGF